LNFDFKGELILEDNVKVRSVGGGEDNEDFILSTDSLLIIEKEDKRTPDANQDSKALKDLILSSMKKVTIEKEGLSITGEDMYIDTGLSKYILKRNIEIKGNVMELSDFLKTQKPVQSSTDSPETGSPLETQEETIDPNKLDPGAKMSISATGPLELILVPNSNVSETEPGPTLFKLNIENDVSIEQDSTGSESKNKVFDLITSKCDRLEALFLEKPDGTYEVQSINGFGGDSRTSISLKDKFQDIKIFSDNFDYREDENVVGGKTYVLSGAPEIKNISASVFSTGNEKERSSKLSFKCDGLITIKSVPTADETGMLNHVTLSEGVTISDSKDPKKPLLKADEMSFDILPDTVGNDEKDTKRSSPSMENLHAFGNVSGKIEDQFTFSCHDFKFKVEDLPTGAIRIVDLLSENYIKSTEEGLPEDAINRAAPSSDKKMSSISSGSFDIESPKISIRLDPDLTVVSAFEEFTCTSKMDKLPRIESFDLTQDESSKNETVKKDASGEITLSGKGKLRILLKGEGENLSQDLTIEESEKFTISMIESNERGELIGEVLHLDGQKTFSLSTMGGLLRSMNLLNGGKLTLQQGFSAKGDILRIRSDSEDEFTFTTEGADGSAQVTLPGEPAPLKVNANFIEILSGQKEKLTARGKVDSLFPGSFFIEKQEVNPPLQEALDEAISSEPKKKTMSFDKGIYHLLTDKLTIMKSQGSNTFTLTAEGDETSVQNEDLGLHGRCKFFDVNSDSAKQILIITLKGTPEKKADIKKTSKNNADVFSSIESSKIDLELSRDKNLSEEANSKKSTIYVYPGGELLFTQSKSKKDEIIDQTSPYSLISIKCLSHIVLKGDYLTCNGPVEMLYKDLTREDLRKNLESSDLLDQDPGAANTRSMTCNKLYVYFTKSPLLSEISKFDLNTYLNKVQNTEPIEVDQQENMIKRIKAQENVVLDYDENRVECSLLNWDIINDKLICDGVGKYVVISINNMLYMKGTQIVLRPANEEISVIK